MTTLQSPSERRKFRFGYHTRVMACLPNDTPVELARSQTKMSPREITMLTSPLDRAWTHWVETVTQPKHLIGPRPIPEFIQYKAWEGDAKYRADEFEPREWESDNRERP